MDELTTMWATVPPASPAELAGARRRLLNGMRPRRRFVTTPRLLVAAGIAVAISTSSLLIGTGSAAYAVTKNPDGTISVAVHELRNPAGLEADLRGLGIKADVTFLPPDTRCAQEPRFASVDPAYGGSGGFEPGADKKWRSLRATRPVSPQMLRIFPAHINPDETLVLQYWETPDGPGPWRLGAWLAQAGTSVKPCTPVPNAP
ncbi:hypothetical protein ACGFJC_24900 [Nonomuraea fuscirosea]|uniref:hypothetical protein n=1 Tax=Nonomuraea fuscirosea TaxID=1291556 RepID=UPI003476C553